MIQGGGGGVVKILVHGLNLDRKLVSIRIFSTIVIAHPQPQPQPQYILKLGETR